MAASSGSADATRPELIRLRLRDRTLIVPSLRPVASTPRISAGPTDSPKAAPEPVIAIPPPAAPPPVAPERRQADAPAPARLGFRPVIAVVEAAPSGVEQLMTDLIAEVEATGGRCGVVSLDRQNRLAGRFDCPGFAPQWCWNASTPELFIRQFHRLVVAAPDSEAGLQPEAVQRVVRTVMDSSDVVVIDLGCRWEPRLFRPVLTLATNIWLVTRAGQWTAMEMRLEQAEFSGWTDMSRVRSVALGNADLPPAGLSSVVTLPPAGGWVLQEFLARELRGGRM